MKPFDRIRRKVQKYSKREQILLVLVVFLVIISFVLLICLLVDKNGGSVCSTPECIEAAHHILTTVDQTVDPCDDFYKFSCGNFLKDAIAKNLASPLKPLDEMKKNGLKQIVIEYLEDEDNLPQSFRNQRKFYRACMNTTAIEEDKDETFLAVLKEVTGGWPLYQGYIEDLNWPEIMVRAREKGVKFDFFLDVDIRYVHSESSIYIEVGPPPIKNFDKHLWKEANLEKIIDIADYWRNASVIGANWEVRKTVEFAKNLKQIVEKVNNETERWSLKEEKMTISKLKTKSFLQLDWLQFLRNMTNLTNLKAKDIILFSVSEKYLEDLYYLIQKTEKKFEGVAESQYIRKVVTEEKRKHIKEIIKNIKAELKDSVKITKWMDKDTKESATEHLSNVTELIGWTDVVFNETECEKVFGFHKLSLESDNIIRINQQVSKTYYDMRFSKIGTNMTNYFDILLSTPLLEVNAFYVKYVKMLILIAPILHPPIYDQNRPEYMNYGALGSIIGHELTHAVSKVDDDLQMFGNHVDDYWSNDTHVRYEEEAECINDEYDSYVKELEGNFTNATETLLENLADLTGLNLAYQAYQKWVDRHGTEKQLPGVKYSPNQLFWIMASTYMCLEPKLQDSEQQNSHGRHAVASFRVVGPIRNSPYFGKDFDCPEGSNMNPKKKCRLFL